MFPRFFLLMFASLCLVTTTRAASQDSQDPQVALRLVVVDSYGGESMGRCSLTVESKAGKAHFIVKDSGTTATRLFPSTWHVEGVYCSSVKASFDSKLSSFEIPNAPDDISLGTLVVVFRAEDVAEEIKAARERRRLIAGSVAGAVGGIAMNMAAQEFVDELPLNMKVKAKADLRIRWNDRNLAPEVQAVLGNPNPTRVPLKVVRED